MLPLRGGLQGGVEGDGAEERGEGKGHEGGLRRPFNRRRGHERGLRRPLSPLFEASPQAPPVIFKDVRFCPILNFVHFWAALLKMSGFYHPKF